ncbi:FAD-dependent oxidoreductase [Salana multivorans]
MSETHLSGTSENETWDVIVVGGGAAGLSAALTLGRARRQVLVIDAGEPRNRFAAHMHGSLGNEGIDPAQLLQRGREEVSAYDVTIRPGTVHTVADADRSLAVTLTDGETLTARAVIAATGLSDDLPDIPGLAEQWGSGVLHCPYCHGWEVRGQRLAVLGTSPMSLHQAELIRQWSDHLVFFTAACGPVDPALAVRLRARGVELIDTAVVEVLAEQGRLTGVRLADGRTVALDAMFTAPAPRPHEEFLAGLDLERAENPMGSVIAVDPVGRTSHPRVWAIGNLVNPGANVPISIGAGSMTGGMVNMALVTEEFDDAVAGELTPGGYWENEYAGSTRRWSGRVNQTMAEIVGSLPVGDALDLGCGEGGDAVWLAEQGWQVTAVDISPTATARGAEGAAARGVANRITWVHHDLSTWTTEQTFDLVTASFFHSTVELPRTEILRRAAGQLRPGGHLLIVSHVFKRAEDVPPWALRHHKDDDGGNHAGNDAADLEARLSVLLTPGEEVAELALGEAEWEVVTEEIRSREATGPDGQETATVKDGVVLVRRR